MGVWGDDLLVYFFKFVIKSDSFVGIQINRGVDSVVSKNILEFDVLGNKIEVEENIFCF